MDTIRAVWPLLDEDQRSLLESMATALAGAPKQTAPEYLTVADIEGRYKKYGCSKRSVYKAMDEGRLAYTTPEGQSKPRYATREDVERWLFRRPASSR